MTHAIEIWSIPLGAANPMAGRPQDFLSSDELQRRSRFKHAQDRDRWTHARCALRSILAHRSGLTPQQIRFEFGPYGKPTIALQDSAAPLHFNLSHSHERALLAISQSHAVGVDIEYLSKFGDMPQVAKRVFTPYENSLLGEFATDGYAQRFYALWTCKEALIKATGDGLSIPLQTIEVCSVSRATCDVRRIAADEPDQWQLARIDVGTGYAAALAYRHSNPLQIVHKEYVQTQRPLADSHKKSA